MNSIFKAIFGAMLCGVLAVVMGYGRSVNPDTPEGALYYQTSPDGDFSITLWEDELYAEGESFGEIEIFLDELKSFKRTGTKFRFVRNDGAYVEFGFLLLLEAKQFEAVLEKTLEARNQVE